MDKTRRLKDFIRVNSPCARHMLGRYARTHLIMSTSQLDQHLESWLDSGLIIRKTKPRGVDYIWFGIEEEEQEPCQGPSQPNDTNKQQTGENPNKLAALTLSKS